MSEEEEIMNAPLESGKARQEPPRVPASPLSRDSDSANPLANLQQLLASEESSQQSFEIVSADGESTALSNEDLKDLIEHIRDRREARFEEYQKQAEIGEFFNSFPKRITLNVLKEKGINKILSQFGIELRENTQEAINEALHHYGRDLSNMNMAKADSTINAVCHVLKDVANQFMNKTVEKKEQEDEFERIQLEALRQGKRVFRKERTGEIVIMGGDS